jgi:LemA protein
MRNVFRSTMGAIAAIVVVLSLSGCGYNDLQRQDEQIKSAWAEVLNQYQRRAELINDPQAFAKFQAAQGQLQSALSRLLVVAENYPNLKSDQNFRDLQAQLEGTENRITVARNRYIKSVQEYNVTVRSFPTNLTAMLFKMDAKPNFSVDNEKAISAPPTVDFTKQPATPAVPAPAPAK